MKAFFKAIMDKFKSNAPLLASVTGLYLGEAKEGTAFPYITFNVGDNADQTFTEQFDDFDVQFDIYSEEESVAQAADILELLKTCFDPENLTLTIDGYQLISAYRRDARTLKWMVEGKNVWNVFQVYHFRTQKN